MIDRATMIGETVLNRFHVDYRLISLSKGALFFCEMGDGTTFDLFLNQEGISRVWKFIFSETAEEIGTQLVFQNPSCPKEKFGFVLEEEGVVSCYLERLIDDENRAEAVITAQLNWFFRLLRHLQL